MAVRDIAAISSNFSMSSRGESRPAHQGRRVIALAAIAASGVLLSSRVANATDQIFLTTPAASTPVDFTAASWTDTSVTPNVAVTLPSTTIYNLEIDNGGTVTASATDLALTVSDIGMGDGGGSATFNQSGDNITINGWFRFAQGAVATTSTYNLMGGTLLDNGQFHLGEYSAAVMNVSGGTFTQNTGGGAFSFGTNNGGSGVLNIMSGGTFTDSGSAILSIGANTNTSGVINMMGGNFNVTNGSDASKVSLSTGSTSTGTINLSGGTFNTGNNELWVGQGGHGYVTQTGGTMTVGNWLVIGRGNGNGNYNMSAGNLNYGGGSSSGNFEIAENGSTGLFTISGGSVVVGETVGYSAANQFFIGAGGNGTLNMSGGTLTVHNWIAVSRTANTGILNISGGTITQDTTGNITTGATGIINQTGGAINNPTQQLWIGEQGTSGTWNMSGGSANTGILNIDQGVTGTLNMSVAAGITAPSITTVTMNIGDAGSGNTSKGTVNMSGGSITTTNLNVSNITSGTLNMSGGTVTATTAIVGVSSRTATVIPAGIINLSGTAVLNATTLQVGENGTATVNLNAGGTLSSTQVSGGLATHLLNFNGGTLQASANSSDLLHGFTGTTANLTAGVTNTIDTQAYTANISSVLSGTGGFTKVGTGTLALTGSSTYSGVTAVKTGVLQAGVLGYNNTLNDSNVVAYYPFTTATTTNVSGTLQYNDISTDKFGNANQNNLAAFRGTASTISTTSSPPGQSGGSLQLGPNNASAGDFLSTPGPGVGLTVGPYEVTQGVAPSDFPIGNSSYTFAAYINLDGTNVGTNVGNGIIGYGTFGQSKQTNFFRTGDDGSHTTQSALNNSWFNDDANGNTPSTTIGVWNYVAVTYDAATDVRQLWFNGVPIEQDAPGINNATNLNFTVGGDPGFGYYFSGNMADLLVTTDALNATQLQNVAANGITFGSTAAVISSTSGTFSPNSSVSIASGASMDLNGTSQTIAGLQDPTVSPGGVATSTVAAPSVLTLATTGANSFSGTINNGAGTVALKVTGTGSQTLSGSNSYTGGTTVGTGLDSPTLVLSGKTAFPAATALTVNSGTLQIAAHTGAISNVVLLQPSLFTIGGTTGAWTGKVDVTNNDLDLAGASLGTVTNQVKTGFASGVWSGNGITSSTAAANTSYLTAVGVATGLTSLDGVTVGSTDVLVKYTYYGDTNLDGAVDGSDYSNIDNGFHNGLSGWQNGDFNYDGVVDGSDYTLIDNTFNTQGASLGTNPLALIASNTAQIAGGSSAVPEPTTLGLIGIGAAGVLARRRRK